MEKHILKYMLERCQSLGFAVSQEHKETFLEIVKKANGSLKDAEKYLQFFIKNGKVEQENIPTASEEAVQVALSGDFDTAMELILNHADQKKPEEIIKEMLEAIHRTPKKTHRIKLYMELAKSSRAVQMGVDFKVELYGLIAAIWLTPHLNLSDSDAASREPFTN